MVGLDHPVITHTTGKWFFIGKWSNKWSDPNHVSVPNFIKVFYKFAQEKTTGRRPDGHARLNRIRKWPWIDGYYKRWLYLKSFWDSRK